MEKIKNGAIYFAQIPTLITIILGGGLVFWQAVSGSLPPSVQIAFFLFFLFVTGIPHGALDHLIEQKTAEKRQNPFVLSLFLAKYLFTMVVYGFLWYIAPTFSLLFFLIISAWHFGETDLEKVPLTLPWYVARFLFGGLVLSTLLLSHAEEVTPIWSRVVQNEPFAVAFWHFASEHSKTIIICWSLILVVVLALAQQKAAARFDIGRLIRLAIVLILTYLLPLLPAFGLYFGGWHALCSFKSIQEYLIQNNRSSFKTSILIWSKALPFTAGAFLFLGFAVWYWQHYLQAWDSIPLLFVFLSLITLPHLNVMHAVNRNN